MTSNNTPSSDYEANRYTAEPPKVSRTLISDFGWMLPDLPDHAWRVYCCVRAFIFDKDPEAVSVQLTDEEIARLIGRSESAVKRGRRECYKHGLLYEHDRNTKHYYPENASHWVRTVRTLGVTLDPPNEWSGPTNCYARLREIRAEIQTERAAKPEGSQVTTQDDQEDSEGSSVFPGQPEGSQVTYFGSNSTYFGSNSTYFGSNSTDPPRGVQHKTRLHLSPHVSFHLSHQQQQRAADAAGGVGGEGEPPTDNNQDEVTDGSADDGAGDDAEARARQLIVNLRPTRDPASRVQPHRGVVQPVSRALRADVPEEAIREYLVEGSETARQPAAIVVTRARNIDDLIQIREEAARRKAQREDQDQDQDQDQEDVNAGQPLRLPACRTCGAFEGDASSQRVVENTAPTGRAYVKCPDCRPSRQQQEHGESVADLANGAATALGLPV